MVKYNTHNKNNIDTNMTKLVEEYLNYHQKYTKLYGDAKTFILMQVGSFYEAYGTDTEGPDLLKISKLIGTQRSKKGKNEKPSVSHPYFTGFPTVSLFKFVDILIENDYVVIIIDQISSNNSVKFIDKKNGEERKVTNIYSKGTYIENLEKNEGNYIVSIFVSLDPQKDSQSLLSVGIAAVDVSTGHALIHEAYSHKYDEYYSLDEADRFIESYNPKEIFVYFQDNTKEKNKNETILKEKILEYLKLDDDKCTFGKVDQKYTNITVQNTILKKVYSKEKAMITPIEQLGLEMNIYATIALTILFDNIHNKNPVLLSSVAQPQLFTGNTNLVLGNNAISQLDVIERDKFNTKLKFKSLFHVVNNTSTALGERFLKNRLMSPLVEMTKLTQSYDMIDQIIQTSSFSKLEEFLDNIKDIERLQRKIELGILRPIEISYLLTSYENISELVNFIKKNVTNLKNILPTDKIIEQMKNFDKLINDTFVIDELFKYVTYDLETQIFKNKIHADVDELFQGESDNHNQIEDIANALSELLLKDTVIKTKSRSKPLTVGSTSKSGSFIKMAQTRGQTLRKKLYEENCELIVKSKPFDTSKLKFSDMNSANVKITLKTTKQNKFDDPKKRKDEIIKLNKKYFLAKLNDIFGIFSSVFLELNKFVALIDFLKSAAKTATKYGYSRPTITKAKHSYVKVQQLRHPIIERLIAHEYIPHDVELGNNLKGMMIYGLNSSGKCFSPDTLIMMYDNTIKKAKDIKKGDQLMGDNSAPRNVLDTTKGTGQMYELIPSNFSNTERNDSIIVNGPHILCLVNSDYKCTAWDGSCRRYRAKWYENGQHKSKSFSSVIHETKEKALEEATKFLDSLPDKTNEIIEISVDDYLKKNTAWKDNYLMYKVGIDYEEQNLEIDPYVLGYWLGDGTNSKPDITTQNQEIVDYYKKYFEEEIKEHGLYVSKNCDKSEICYSITTKKSTGGKGRNYFTNFLRKNDLLGKDCKYIPDSFKFNSRKNRMKLLAGIIDSDGYNSENTGLDICLKSKQLLEDIIFLARSLGFSCHLSECEKTCTNSANGPVTGTYYRTFLSGSVELFKEIPLLLEYKRPTNVKKRGVNHLKYSFEVKKLKIQEYCGFEVDGNKRFLLDNFTVTHNSSCMKAIGLTVIMAQSGLYVPADSFELSPYNSLYTRITGDDNIFRGLSSFSLEMVELNAILKRASQNTLVIGDEVCRGTEHISGNSLVAAALIKLSKSNASFIFASHLHEIMEFDEIKELSNVKAFHLSVKYDEKTKALIFDRQMKEGSGEQIYGVTVAQHIIQDKEFIDLAVKFRNKLTNTNDSLVSGKTSRYNTAILVDECKICGSNENLETHHINFQKDCDLTVANGIVKNKKHLTKNSEANLITLCGRCHDLIHSGDLVLDKYIMTSEGKTLLVKEPKESNEKIKPKKVPKKTK